MLHKYDMYKDWLNILAVSNNTLSAELHSDSTHPVDTKKQLKEVVNTALATEYLLILTKVMYTTHGRNKGYMRHNFATYIICH